MAQGDNGQMLILRGDDVMLRDPHHDDLADYQRWFSVETEWAEWDAPWGELPTALAMVDRIRHKLQSGPNGVRTRLEVCLDDGAHVGAVASYHDKQHFDALHLGLDLYEPAYWGRGIGTQALKLWMAYLFEAHGASELFCATWSGNERMVRLAARCEFRELERRDAAREVRGNSYDALRFVASRTTFFDANPGFRSE